MHETPDPTPPALDATLRRMIDFAEADRSADLLALVDPEITVDYGVDGQGHDAFLATWRHSGPRPWDRFIGEMLAATRDGGAAQEGGFLFPYHAAVIHGDLARLARPTHDAPLLAAPGLEAAAAQTGGARTGLCDRPGCEGEGDWAALTMPGGARAYTPKGALRPWLRTWRAAFSQTADGRWQLTALVRGD